MSCLMCGQVAPFKSKLASNSEIGVCFQCSLGAEQAKPVAVVIEDARERLDVLIAESSGDTRSKLDAIDAVLQDAKRRLGHPNAGLERYQHREAPTPQGTNTK